MKCMGTSRVMSHNSNLLPMTFFSNSRLSSPRTNSSSCMKYVRLPIAFPGCRDDDGVGSDHGPAAVVLDKVVFFRVLRDHWDHLLNVGAY